MKSIRKSSSSSSSSCSSTSAGDAVIAAALRRRCPKIFSAPTANQMIPTVPPMRSLPGARPQGHATQVAFRHHLPIPLGYGIQMVLGYRIPVVVVFMKNARVFQKPVPLGYGIPMVLGYGSPVVLVLVSHWYWVVVSQRYWVLVSQWYWEMIRTGMRVG